jgi:hypothetical protein
MIKRWPHSSISLFQCHVDRVVPRNDRFWLTVRFAWDWQALILRRSDAVSSSFIPFRKHSRFRNIDQDVLDSLYSRRENWPLTFGGTAPDSSQNDVTETVPCVEIILWNSEDFSQWRRRYQPQAHLSNVWENQLKSLVCSELSMKIVEWSKQAQITHICHLPLAICFSRKLPVLAVFCVFPISFLVILTPSGKNGDWEDRRADRPESISRGRWVASTVAVLQCSVFGNDNSWNANWFN